MRLKSTIRNNTRVATIRPLAIALVAVAGLAGCGDDTTGDGDPNPEDDGCMLTATLTGAVSESLDYDESMGCSGSSTETATSLSWGGFGGDEVNFSLSINGSTKEKGTGIPARVSINGAGSWSTPIGMAGCTVDITSSVKGETDSIGTSYTVAGKGTCTEVAIDSAGVEEDVTVGPFEFRGDTLFP